MKTSLSLWPDDIGIQQAKAPVAILREQASILGNLTKNLVQGEIYGDNLEDDRFGYEFFITSPPLGNYQYKLLAIYHDISLYPVKISVERAIQKELETNFKLITLVNEGGGYDYILAETEEEFMEALKLIFRAKKTVQVITALLSQADPNWQAKGDWARPISKEPDYLTTDDISF